MTLSNLDIINECDSFPYPYTDPALYNASLSTYYTLRIPDCNHDLGYMLPSVATVFDNVPNWSLDHDARTLTLTAGTNASERSAAVHQTLLALRQTGHFKVLDKWRDELYGVYGPGRELLFSVERSASPLFGIVTYGVHMNAYVRGKDGELKIWVPRRARTKQTYGGMLDNCVAGGIAVGETALECLVRECAEEASLPEDIVRERVKSVGCVTYFHIRTEKAGGETGLMQPECQYVYDIELPEDVVPKPGDDEVEEFYLWGVEEVREALGKGEFKPNCGLVMVDYFVRMGELNAENEGDLIEICARLHRRLEFPTL
ncbi:thiamine pyrophosphokinase-related protein-like protein [Sporormia fimetaria CBS 119925]|uniref:Thiamine pyrophosphokinase-related protein-like protein n=1 Tax=Sporormia fimetaria CBS 119925 TaxID=1340428 RepID=A0A6A6VKE3_9PLEO|nr:thiamine pyrophosphokinase-related protein-like protein [Sporormia fimetaria CBS 119925]